MDPFTATMLVSTGLQIYGQYKANSDEAEAHLKNAEHADKMAEYNKLVAQREEEVYRTQYAQKVAQTELGYGASGVTMSGSALDQIAYGARVAQQEIQDIKLKGQMNVADLEHQAGMSRSAAEAASDPFNNLLQATGTGLTAYAQYKGATS